MTGLTVDEVLAKIGSFGCYQIRLIIILSFAEWVNTGFQVMIMTFVGAEPPWQCVANSSACTLKGEMGTSHKNYSVRCSLNRSDWEFTTPFTSVVTEFDLVCDNTFLASVSSSVLFASWLFTSLASGVLSDKIGRKPVFFVFIILAPLFGFLSAFPRVFWLFTVFRLLVGVGIGGSGMPMFVLATEFVGVKHRHMAGTCLFYSWALSLLSLGGIAYLIRDWRTLIIVLSVPGIIFVGAWWFVPESARYLILKGKIKEADQVLRHIADVNKKEYPTEPLHDPTQDGEQKLGDIRDLFRTKKMIHRTLVSWYSWFVNGLVYYGVSFSSPSLGGNMYLSFFLTSVVELPANWFAIYCLGKFGRKKTLVVGLVMSALASIGAVLITMYDPGNHKGYTAGVIIMAMAAKFFVFMSFDAIYVYSAELFPTVVRNVGMGTSTAAGRIGSFSAPYVVNLNRIHPLLPYGIMASQAFLAGMVCLTLPETKDKPTEETMTGDANEAAVNEMAIEEMNATKPCENGNDAQQPTDKVQLIEVAKRDKNSSKESKEIGYDNTAFYMTGLTVDEVLAKIGSLGFYQIRLIIILSFAGWVNLGFQIMIMTFIGAEPPWQCAANSSACTLKGEMGTSHKNYSVRCSLNRSDWEFTTPFTSVVTEFDLVCDNTFLASVSSSVLFASWLFTSLASGVLSDKIGRKPVFFVFIILAPLFGLLSAFPRVFWLFTVFRLLVGVGVGGSGMPKFVLATEFVGVKHRHIAGNCLWYAWTLSLLSLAGIAYLIRDWRTLTIVLSVPGIIFVGAWWFVPESARYLILKGKINEAEQVLRHIAKVNKKEYPTEPLHDPTQDGEQKLGDIRDLFRTKKMIHRTLVSWYSWFVNALVYYGVSFSSPSLGGNMYLNFFLTSVVELPANWFAIFCLGKFGRKKTLVVGLVMSALASIGAVLITMHDPGNHKGYTAGVITMAMAAKFFVFMSFDAIYVYSAELFPTVVRNVGMGSSTAAGRIGSFSAPYVVNLNRIHPLLPYGIMASQAFLAGMVCLTLSETKDKPTEETMTGDANDAAVNEMAIEEMNATKPRENDNDVQQPTDKVQRIEVAERDKNSSKESKEIGYDNTVF
ncbi:hypothetical protein QZH41_013408 [Actinostola sp. cb2023]|nr:hypothetical protein QZH41_013408 [Actinostola sp. cb2023]